MNYRMLYPASMNRACTMLNRTVLRGRVPFSGARLPTQTKALITTSAASGGAASTTAKPNISDLAKMAQVSISEQEAADWAPKINSVLDWFGQLQSVDVKGVVPAIHAYSEGNRLRPDEPQPYPARSQLLAQAPQTENTYVRVPKTAGGGDGAAGEAAAAPKAAAAAAAAAPAGVSAAPAAAASAPTAAAPADAGAPREAVGALDIRVGRIVSCERHPDAESLYVEKIDVGEAEPRTIVSGLVKYVPLEEMQDRLVVVICNLKPRNMRGIKSFGMLLAASDEPHLNVEPLVPPPGARAGERVWFGDDAAQPPAAEPKLVDKKKYWEAVQPLLRTDGGCVATLAVAAGAEGQVARVPLNTSAGPIRAASLTGARIA
ncbi:hypothetical protein PLESTB_000217600 [Pleodorina starrii]|uniref:Glutamyl-tRNA(Gln) amidotransferase subunit C, chloroplastic/mitochondrial n=1 Tax=Pleodorina starrii TaxID=330485 RepID=A0A9W6EXY1_9CHLO|nr:hypothetical protein PLESTM_001543300 [Pleodorina starrii]GLC49423.1 hypothetical protein PLESTB_000217600 [Pleodorina starrii]GLC75655.1 hypothetical protein PLESTF_001670600 [Pleodorina starrii]